MLYSAVKSNPSIEATAALPSVFQAEKQENMKLSISAGHWEQGIWDQPSLRSSSPGAQALSGNC